ncbi:Endoribonuclease L-PSP [Caulifigura coniformis]|uniref:Endoribonuclease L-PSP n=1 Tax=Caulifigura coniformis TaxID=2527983 RepID=A0A517SC12_9PLAN|nr:RidA family protein [Caulifigura coniformis]QDT53655.1 Endoribonuclease L-PSP [Caulifigura coniformis]
MRRMILACLVLAAADVSGAEFSIRRLAPEASLARSGAVRVDHADLLYSTQFVATGEGPLSAQQQELLDRLAATLQSAGLKFDDIIKLNLYVRNEQDIADITAELSRRFNSSALPAVSWVVTTLPAADARLALDFVAAHNPAQPPLKLPESKAGQRLLSLIPAATRARAFISGQAEKGEGTVADSTKQTMASLFRTLKFLEMKPADVVQVKVFIAPMTQVQDSLGAVQAAFAPGDCPPVVFVEWKSPSLPVEIELVAATSEPQPFGRPVVEYLAPPELKHSPVYSRIARVQSPATIYFSGLYGSQADPDSEAELRDLFAQTKTLAEEAGSDLRHLLKATYYVSSKGSSDQHNKLRPEYYDPARPPAASKAIVTGVGRPGRTITWDMIAVPKGK